MSTGGAGPDGFLPRMPVSLPGVDPSLTGLSIAGPAGSGPFLVEGGRACVSGHQRAPVGRVELYGVGVVDDFRMGADRAANLVVYPGMTRRDFIGRAGLYVETVVVAPDLPLIVVTRGGTAPDEGGGTFSFRLALCDDACEADRDPGSFVSHADAVALVGPDGVGIAVGITPTPGQIEVGWESDRRLRVTVTCAADEPLSVVVAGGSARDVQTAFTAAGHLKGHTIRAANGPTDGGLFTSSGVNEIDEGIGWLRTRVHRRLDRLAARGTGGGAADAADRDDALMLGLAAIAVGDRAGSERAITLAKLAGTPERAVLAGRHASCFGDVSFAAEVARRWGEPLSLAGSESGRDSAAHGENEMWRLAGRLLADGLLYAATDELRARLQKAPAGAMPETGAGPATGGSRSGRSLPVVGSAARVTRAARIAALLGGEPSPDSTAPTSPDMASTGTLPGLFRRDPGTAWMEWRRQVTSGLEDGPAGPASWREVGNEQVAAHLLLALAHGMLGLVVDAPAGRVRLAPRLPAHLTAFTVGGITVGDVTFSLDFERAGDRRVFTLRPEHAPVPPFVVFEAGIPGTPGEVRIDGVRAELEPRTEHGSTVYPLQFALDAPRTVEIIPGEALGGAQPSTTM